VYWHRHPYDIERRRVRIARVLSPLLEPLVGMEAIAYRGSIALKNLIRLDDEAYAISPGKCRYLHVGREVLIEEVAALR
jgi:hypothetical protein